MSDAVAYEKAQEFFCAFSLIRIWTEDLIELKKIKVHDFLLYILTDIAEIEKVTLDSMVKVTELRIKEAVMWIFYAIGSSFFAGITAILAKCGIQKTDSDVATAIRTVVVQIFSWLMVLITGAGSGIGKIGTRTMVFLVLSGLSTGASWLCYYHALQQGPASVVVAVDKLSILVTIAFSWAVFHEKLTKKATLGVACMTVGTLLLAVM